MRLDYNFLGFENNIEKTKDYSLVEAMIKAIDKELEAKKLSKSIITAMKQVKGARLTYALINKVIYSSLSNSLNFIL